MTRHFSKIIGFLILLITSVKICAQQAILSADASNYVGKLVSICDVVSGARYLESSVSKVTLLNMGGRYPNQSFTVVINGDARKNFPNSPEVYYLNKTICVNGRVELYNGKPQMHILTPSDISYNEGAKPSPGVAANTATVKKSTADTSGSVTHNAVSATTQKKPVEKVAILKKDVQVRSGPGLSFDVVKTLPAGEAVNVHETRQGWSHIVYEAGSTAKKQSMGFVLATDL